MCGRNCALAEFGEEKTDAACKLYFSIAAGQMQHN
jgi:hypothetical protein